MEGTNSFRTQQASASAAGMSARGARQVGVVRCLGELERSWRNAPGCVHSDGGWDEEIVNSAAASGTQEEVVQATGRSRLDERYPSLQVQRNAPAHFAEADKGLAHAERS